MKRPVKNSLLAIALSLASALVAREAAAIELMLNLVQQNSFIDLSGHYISPGSPFHTQEGTPGTTDLNPARPSMSTTYQGWIKVDVDNVNNPTSIRILESFADADVGGTWLPEIPPEGPGEYSTSGPPPTDAPPAVNADYGLELRHPSFGVDLAYGAYRGVVFNVTSGVEPVAAGLFSSLSENFEFGTVTPDPNDPDGTILDDTLFPGNGGWFDYWVNPAAGNIRGRSDNTGGDDDNVSALSSSYLVTMLPNNKREIKLTLPIDVDSPDPELSTFLNGQFVATLIVPEPSSFLLMGIGTLFTAFAGRRIRK
jgi:hypothetical protein